MTRYALIGALVALLGAVGALWWVMGQRDSARADAARLQMDLSTARQQIELAAQTAGIHRAHISRMAKEQGRLTLLLTDLETMEGRDAPVSDYLDAAGRKLWPQ
jgi:multidrug efflux pump subunit AcrA (membrane-fusion protein)